MIISRQSASKYGQGLAEYSLIGVLVAVACIPGIMALVNNLNNGARQIEVGMTSGGSGSYSDENTGSSSSGATAGDIPTSGITGAPPATTVPTTGTGSPAPVGVGAVSICGRSGQPACGPASVYTPPSGGTGGTGGAGAITGVNDSGPVTTTVGPIIGSVSAPPPIGGGLSAPPVDGGSSTGSTSSGSPVGASPAVPPESGTTGSTCGSGGGSGSCSANGGVFGISGG